MKIETFSAFKPVIIDRDPVISEESDSVVPAVNSKLSVEADSNDPSSTADTDRRHQLAGLIIAEIEPVQAESLKPLETPAIRMVGSELAQFLLVESSHSSAGKVVRRLNRKFAEERKKQALNKYKQLKTQALHDQVLSALETSSSGEASGSDDASDFGSILDFPDTISDESSTEPSIDEALQNVNQSFSLNRVA